MFTEGFSSKGYEVSVLRGNMYLRVVPRALAREVLDEEVDGDVIWARRLDKHTHTHTHIARRFSHSSPSAHTEAIPRESTLMSLHDWREIAHHV